MAAHSVHRLLLALFLVVSASSAFAAVRRYDWVLRPTNITRLCHTQELVTVNGMFPGPTLYAQNGDLVIVSVFNDAKYNATLHWHGVKQRKNPWVDGPEFVTQCPIRPGERYTYRFKIEDQQGTLFWHAHYSWLRATVHGAIVIHPKPSQGYPYPHPGHEEVVILGEWWNEDPMRLEYEFMYSGGSPKISNTLLINGQPGRLLACSETPRIKIREGKGALLRIVNAAMAYTMFLGIHGHNLTVVAADAIYTKPLTTDVIAIGPGETTDVLLTTQGKCGETHYMATHVYWGTNKVPCQGTVATAIIEYTCDGSTNSNSTPTTVPSLPPIGDSDRAEAYYSALRSLNSESYPSIVPQGVMDNNLFYVEIPGMLPCDHPNFTCQGPYDERIIAGLNNISFIEPRTTSILEAYYFNISGVYTADFPDRPPEVFNFTNTTWPVTYSVKATKARALKFNSTVELVLQSVGIFGGENHNFHLHGHDFWVVGRGFGNYDPLEAPKHFNLADPPKKNTFNLPFNGWAVIRFVADNPGVWFFHCHVDYHMSIGMSMVFITEDGPGADEKMLPPPPSFRRCSCHQTESGLAEKSTKFDATAAF